MQSGAEFEIKPKPERLQVLARIWAASLKERQTCLKVADEKPTTMCLTSITTEPTGERSGFTELSRWIRDKQSETKITLSKFLSLVEEEACLSSLDLDLT